MTRHNNKVVVLGAGAGWGVGWGGKGQGAGARKVGYCGTHPRVHFIFELSSLLDIPHSED